MPRRKPKPEKVIQEKIKESLDAIIMEESLDDVTVAPNTSELPRLKTTDLMDFSKEKTSALSDAQALLDSISRFYVDPSVYGTEDHVELKKKMDATNLSAMMFQLKSAQHAITKLLEEIDLGNAHPRVFEVLAQLQSQIMQMPKDYQQYLEKMEQNYRKAKSEIEEKRISGGAVMNQTDTPSGDSTFRSIQPPSQSGIKTRGTRGIMEGLREVLANEIIDVKPIEVSPNAVVNARDKKVIDSQNIITKEDDDSGDFFIIEDDIIE